MVLGHGRETREKEMQDLMFRDAIDRKEGGGGGKQRTLELSSGSLQIKK